MKILAWLELKETVRHQWWVIYLVSFFGMSSLIFYLGAREPLQSTASLLNLVLLLVPLFSLIFGCISFSESLPFQEILVAIPIPRFHVYFGKWLGLNTGLASSFLFGMGLSALFNQVNAIFPIVIGILLTSVFVSIAFLIANLIRKKELIFSALLITWLFFFVLYDIFIMQVAIFFGDYPLEIPIITMVFLNPIDLARIVLTLQNDLSAMMGYSGALFQKYFGTTLGISISLFVLLLWSALPAYFGFRIYRAKDLT